MGFHVGVLGTGKWARVHLAALAASSHVERVTLAGRNDAARSALAAQLPIVRQAVADYRQVFDDPTVEVVDVVLPHDLHARVTCEALSAGKHVLCEKPAATRLDDFDRSLAAAAAHRRRLLVVMNQLYNPLFQELRRQVEAGAIGRPFLSVENSFTSATQSYHNRHDWRNTPLHAGGGVLIDGGFHLVYRHLDTLASAGPPAWVLADAPQLNVRADGTPEPTKAEDFVSVTVGYPHPLRIAWVHGWTLAAVPQRARQSFLAGSDGTLELTDAAGEPLVLHRPDGSRAAVPIPAGPRTREETLHACLLDYLAALAVGREVAAAPLALARRSLEIILGAYRSSRTGERIALEADTGSTGKDVFC